MIVESAGRPIGAARPAACGSTDDARSAAKGGASLLLLQSLGRIVGLLFVIVATRHLSPAEFGRYSTVAAVVLFGNFLGDFGTSSAITRMISRAPSQADEIISRTLLGSFLLGVLAYGGTVAFAAVSYPSASVTDMAIGALAIPTAAMLSSLLGALDGNGLIARRAAISALQTLTVAAGAVPVLAGFGVRGALMAMAAAPLVCVLLAGASARRAGIWVSPLRIDVGCTLGLLRSAAPYAATGGLAALTMRFDVVLLSLLHSAAETARYDLALRLVEAGTYLSTAFTAPLLFLLSRRLGRGDRDGAGRAFAEAVRLVYLLGLPASIGLALLARPIVSVTLGPNFADAAVPLAVMGAAQWLTWLVSTQSALIMAGDDMRKAVRTGLCIAGVTVALDLVLVPAFGATGAAAAMLVSWTFTAYTLHRFSIRTVGVGTSPPSLRVLASTAIMAGLVFTTRTLPLAVPVLAGGLAYILAALTTGAFSLQEGARLLRLLRGTGASGEPVSPS